jgi:hypothetical protein
VTAHHYRPGFTAHLRKFGIGRAEYRKAKTTLAALVALEEPIKGALARAPRGMPADSYSLVRDVLTEMVGGFP